jgi:hypothetical protein
VVAKIEIDVIADVLFQPFARRDSITAVELFSIVLSVLIALFTADV